STAAGDSRPGVRAPCSHPISVIRCRNVPFVSVVYPCSAFDKKMLGIIAAASSIQGCAQVPKTVCSSDAENERGARRIRHDSHGLIEGSHSVHKRKRNLRKY